MQAKGGDGEVVHCPSFIPAICVAQVSDMAWHYHNETPIDWAGYSWSDELFPAPETFKAWLERQAMNFTLNLHLVITR